MQRLQNCFKADRQDRYESIGQEKAVYLAVKGESLLVDDIAVVELLPARAARLPISTPDHAFIKTAPLDPLTRRHHSLLWPHLEDAILDGLKFVGRSARLREEQSAPFAYLPLARPRALKNAARDCVVSGLLVDTAVGLKSRRLRLERLEAGIALRNI